MVYEQRAALLAGEAEPGDGLAHPREARVGVVVKDDGRAWSQHRAPGLDLGNRLVALVGAVDVEQVDGAVVGWAV